MKQILSLFWTALMFSSVALHFGACAGADAPPRVSAAPVRESKPSASPWISFRHAEGRIQSDVLDQIPIPQMKNGYKDLHSQVLRSQEGLDAFLRQIDQIEWHGRSDVHRDFGSTWIDWSESVIVVVQHTEYSGSVRVRLSEPVLDEQEKRVTIEILRSAPPLRNAAMAYHCFAFVVSSKRVDVVTVLGIDDPVGIASSRAERRVQGGENDQRIDLKTRLDKHGG